MFDTDQYLLKANHQKMMARLMYILRDDDEALAIAFAAIMDSMLDMPTDTFDQVCAWLDSVEDGTFYA